MTLTNSPIIILIVVVFAFYLIYSHNNQSYYGNFIPQYSRGNQQTFGSDPRTYFRHGPEATPRIEPDEYAQHRYEQKTAPVPIQPQITNVVVEGKEDRYSDPIKRQDIYTMYDPLTYPQLRLPREVLDKYNDFYDRTGAYPPFNIATQPNLFDNPVINGILIKMVEENEPFSDNIPNTVPLFRVKSAKNANRYFYYIIDQRYLSKIEPKVPLDHVKVNGVRYNNADFYGIPELFDGDVIDHISIYPGAKFKVTLYKTYHFP